jgi:hypothetical protein
VTRLRPLHNEATARLAESVLHSQARKCTEDATNIRCLKRVKAKAAVVESAAIVPTATSGSL